MQEFQPGQTISPQSAAVQPAPTQPQQALAPTETVQPQPTPLAPDAAQPAPPVYPAAPVQTPYIEQSAVPVVSAQPQADPPSASGQTSLPGQAVVMGEAAYTADPYLGQAPAAVSTAAPGETDGPSWVSGDRGGGDNAARVGLYTLIAIVLGAVIFIIMRDIISIIAILFAVAGLAYFASHGIGTQKYLLREGMLYVGNRPYRLHDFKAFSVNDTDDPTSIVLAPLKRFLPPITLFVPHEMLGAVEEYLGDFLPSEPHKADAIDSLLRRIRL